MSYHSRAYEFTDFNVNRRTYWIYHFTILPILTPSEGMRRQLPHRPMGILACHFPILPFFSARAGLYRKLALQPMAPPVLPFSGCRPYRFLTANRRYYWNYHCTAVPFYHFSALRGFTLAISQSVNEPTGLPFLPFSAPMRGYIAN